MTLTVPTGATPAPAPPVDDLAAPPTSARRHAGCYWDHEQAAWVAYAALPVPRPAQD